MRRILLAGAAAAALTGCAVRPEPILPDERKAEIAREVGSLYAEQEPIAAPVTVHEAMARALKYNADHQVKVLEERLALGQLEVSRLDMLPDVVAQSSYYSRTNEAAASSQSLETGTVSSPSVSQPRQGAAAGLGFSWNVLDFGISYLQAHQDANKSLMAEERRRKALQRVVQDVRSAYWRAVAAEAMGPRVDDLIARSEAALKMTARAREGRLVSQATILGYERNLVDVLREMAVLKKSFTSAKSELAGLMGLRPGTAFSVHVPADYAVPRIGADVAAMEAFALENRPELLAESYQARVDRDEAVKTVISLFPAVKIAYDLQYDPSKFLVNNAWGSFAPQVSWSLINLVQGPARIAQSEAVERVGGARKLALTAAVLTQVNVSVLQFRDSADEFAVADRLAGLDAQLADHARKALEGKVASEVEVVQAEANAVLSSVRRAAAYANVQSALGNIHAALGADVLPSALPSRDLSAVAAALKETYDELPTAVSKQEDAR